MSACGLPSGPGAACGSVDLNRGGRALHYSPVARASLSHPMLRRGPLAGSPQKKSPARLSEAGQVQTGRTAMKPLLILLLAIAMWGVGIVSGRAANTICTNGMCYTCDGALACANGNCTCNGVPIQGKPESGGGSDQPGAPSAQYYYSDNGKPVGPFSLAEIRAKVASGIIKPDTLVWKTGAPSWAAAKEFAELAPTPTPPVPTPTPPVPTPTAAEGCDWEGAAERRLPAGRRQLGRRSRFRRCHRRGWEGEDQARHLWALQASLQWPAIP